MRVAQTSLDTVSGTFAPSLAPVVVALTKPRGAWGLGHFLLHFPPRQVYVLHFLCAMSDQSKVGSGIVIERDAAWLKRELQHIGHIYVSNVCLCLPDVWALWWMFHHGSQRWSLVHLLMKMAFENCVSEDFNTQHSLTTSWKENLWHFQQDPDSD